MDFPGNALGVCPAGLGDALLTQVSVFPNPFTPNGDGLNDVARFQFQLHEVSAPRDLRLRVYDVSGRLVRQLDRQLAIRGLFGEGLRIRSGMVWMRAVVWLRRGFISTGFRWTQTREQEKS